MAKKPVPDIKPEMTASAKSRLITAADLGALGVPYQAILKIRKFKSEMPGKAIYKVVQGLLGILVVLAFRGIFGVPSNTLSNLLSLAFVVGAVLGGAFRFAAWSIIWWGVAGTVAWYFLDMPIVSPSWWRTFHDAWANQGLKVPQWQLGALIAASLFWIAVGRVAARGMGLGIVRLVEIGTISAAQGAEARRLAAEEEQFRLTEVSEEEVDRVVVRSENDARRQVVFGGQKIVKGTGASLDGGISLAKDESAKPMPAADVAREYGTLAGTVSASDHDLIAGAIGDDDDDDGFIPSAPIPFPSASPSSDVDVDSTDEAPSRDAAISVSVSVSTSDLPSPSAPEFRPSPNPTASENSRRLMRENLGSMIGVFKIHTAHDQLEQFYKNSRTRLLRLTDEDYEELQLMEYGGDIIALSRRAKNESLTANRDAVAVATETDMFLAGGDAPPVDEVTPMTDAEPVIVVPDEDDASVEASAADDVDASSTSSGEGARRGDRFAAMLADNLPARRSTVSAADLLATTSVALGARSTEPADEGVDSIADATETSDDEGDGEVRHDIEAVSPEGRTVTFLMDESVGHDAAPAADDDAASGGSGDQEMTLHDYPIEMVIDAYQTMNAKREDYEHREVMVGFKERTGHDALEVLQCATASSTFQPTMLDPILRSIRRAMQLGPDSPIDQLRAMHNERVAIMDVEFKRSPHDFRRLRDRFNTIRGDMQKLAMNNGIVPGAGELMAEDLTLNAEFEIRIQEKISGKPIPRAASEDQPNPFSGVAGEIMAARGAAPRPAAPDTHATGVSAQEAIVSPVSTPIDENHEEDVVVVKLKPGTPETREVLEGLMADQLAREEADNVAAQAREREKAAERDRIAQQEKERQEEKDRLAQEEKEREDAKERVAQEERDRIDREERMASFRSSIGVRTSPLFESIPTRFDDPTVRRALLFVIESHALLVHMRADGANVRNAFSATFVAQHGEPPQPIDLMQLSMVRAENELAIQMGDRVRDVTHLIATIVGLHPTATPSEIRALLVGKDELHFFDILSAQMTSAERATALGDEYTSRTIDEAARNARAEAEARAASALSDVRAEADAAAKAAAVESEAKTRLEDENRDLLARLQISEDRLAAELSRPKTPADEARLWLQQAGTLVENRSALDAYVFERPSGDRVIVVWVPDDVYAQQEVEIDGRMAKLDVVIDRAIVKKVQADLPFGVDVSGIVLVTNGNEDAFRHTSQVNVVVMPPVKADIEAETVA